jgi:hypothetical protein
MDKLIGHVRLVLVSGSSSKRTSRSSLFAAYNLYNNIFPLTNVEIRVGLEVAALELLELLLQLRLRRIDALKMGSERKQLLLERVE